MMCESGHSHPNRYHAAGARLIYQIVEQVAMMPCKGDSSWWTLQWIQNPQEGQR